MNYDITKIRADFPILEEKIYGKQIAYLDNGATTQKPKQVIDAVANIYKHQNSNIHRGIHYLSNQMTTLYEEARQIVRKYINARSEREIIFTSGATEAINTVAYSFGEKYINAGDKILVGQTEHHSNIVPWQILCNKKNAELVVIPVTETGQIDMEKYLTLLDDDKVKLVAISQVSNAFGTVFPLPEIIKHAHLSGAKILVDGSQGIQHIPTDVTALDMDFYVFSGHKIYASNGIGVLYAKEEILEEMPPYKGGGDMIKTVSFERTEYADLPFKFEAGTTNYVGAVSLGKAIEYITSIGLDKIQHHEQQLMDYAHEKFQQISGLTIYGTADRKASCISFLLDGVHFYDTAMILDKEGIAVRSGTHCAEPGMQFFSITGTVRAGFAMYNTTSEIDRLIEGILKVKKMFS